jgi:hypothetical protein
MRSVVEARLSSRNLDDGQFESERLWEQDFTQRIFRNAFTKPIPSYGVVQEKSKGGCPETLLSERLCSAKRADLIEDRMADHIREQSEKKMKLRAKR